MDDRKIIDNKEHLYDETVIVDEINLPNKLKEYINELMEYDKVKDWLSYDLKFDEFEVVMRYYLRDGIISEKTYKQLIARYGWLYD